MIHDDTIDRVLTTISTDSTLIPLVAQAIVRGDSASLRSLLAGGGLELSAEEASAVLEAAHRTTSGAHASTHPTYPTWPT